MDGLEPILYHDRGATIDTSPVAGTGSLAGSWRCYDALTGEKERRSQPEKESNGPLWLGSNEYDLWFGWPWLNLVAECS